MAKKRYIVWSDAYHAALERGESVEVAGMIADKEADAFALANPEQYFDKGLDEAVDCGNH